MIDSTMPVVKLYQLADKLSMISFKNAVMNEMVSLLEIKKVWFHRMDAEAVLQDTHPSSPLRKLVYTTVAYAALLEQRVDGITFNITQYLEITGNFAAEFIPIMAQCAQDMDKVQSWSLGGWCTFHDHTDGKPCGDHRVSG